VLFKEGWAAVGSAYVEMVSVPKNYLTKNEVSVSLKVTGLTGFSLGNPELHIIPSHPLSRLNLLL